MSRKSLPKKDAIVWYLCAKCNANVYVKDREEHSEHCPVIESTTCAAIRDKRMVSARLSIQPMTEELRALNARHLINLVFIHESVFGLCEFVLGDYVLISSPALPNGIPIVRMAWPSSNSSMVPTAIGVTDEGETFLFAVNITFNIHLIHRIPKDLERTRRYYCFDTKTFAGFDPSRHIDANTGAQQRANRSNDVERYEKSADDSNERQSVRPE